MDPEKFNSPVIPSEERRTRSFLVLGIKTFAIGSVLVVAAAVLEPYIVRLAFDVLRDLGISLMIAATVGLGVEYYTRKHGEAVLNQMMGEAINRYVFHNDRLHSLGLKQMCINRSELDILKSIRDTEPGGNIQILAMCMDELTHNTGQRIIKTKLEEGCSIKLLLINPESPYVRERGLAEKQEEGPELDDFVNKVRYRDSMHQSFIEALPVDLQEKIEVRHYDSAPSLFIVDNDTTMLIGFYLFGYRGEEVPHLELETKKGGAHVPFREHFEALWSTATICIGGSRTEAPNWDERRRGERRKLSLPVNPDRRKPAA
jgi:hypothetical protein